MRIELYCAYYSVLINIREKNIVVSYFGYVRVSLGHISVTWHRYINISYFIIPVKYDPTVFLFPLVHSVFEVCSQSFQ